MAPPPFPDWRAWHLHAGLVRPAVGLESHGEAHCGGEACQSARVAGHRSCMILCWLAEMTSASQPCLGPAVTRRATRELTNVLQRSCLGSMCQLSCACEVVVSHGHMTVRDAQRMAYSATKREESERLPWACECQHTGCSAYLFIALLHHLQHRKPLY
jgi:hypothetical protein